MFSLYDATVPRFEQMLGAVAGLLDKAEAWCAENGVDPKEFLDSRLAPDMLPFAYQVKSAAVHSIGAIEGVKQGLFSPDRSAPPESFAGLKEKIASARASLAALSRDEVNGLIGKDMRFEIKDLLKLDFLAEDFLLSFSMPNFFFHVTTTYALLRAKGVGIGKRDFLGAMALKG